MSDDLIGRLSRDLRPVRRGFVGRRLSVCLLAGGVIGFACVAGVLGLRPDMGDALRSGIFWVKLAYGGGLAAIGLWCLERLARPGADASGRAVWIAVPWAVVLCLGVLQLWSAAPGQWHRLLFGVSAAVCPWLILLTAVPSWAALAWALRGLAPTRLRSAGAAAGVAAGGAAVAAYALHCPETGAPFVALWYTLGVLLAAAAGALLGPRVLHW